MGNCTPKRSQKSYPSSTKVFVPDLCYINRKLKSLLAVESQEVKTCALKGKIKIYKDSVVSNLQDGNLIIAGGTDSANCLSNSVFLVLIKERTIQEMPKLPIPTKGGHFVKYKS